MDKGNLYWQFLANRTAESFCHTKPQNLFEKDDMS